MSLEEHGGPGWQRGPAGTLDSKHKVIRLKLKFPPTSGSKLGPGVVCTMFRDAL